MSVDTHIVRETLLSKQQQLELPVQAKCHPVSNSVSLSGKSCHAAGMADGKSVREEPAPEVQRNGVTGERESAAAVRRININQLPDEVMVNIFSYLYFSDLIDFVQHVCTRWRRLVRDPALWLDKELIAGRTTPSRLILPSLACMMEMTEGMTAYESRNCCQGECSRCGHCRCELTDEGILRTVAVTPQLRKLTIVGNIEGGVLREICTNLPNLTNLEIHCSAVLDYSLMKHIFEKCPKIKKLTMGANLLTVPRCAELLSILEHLRSVEVFNDSYRLSNLVQVRVLADGCPQLEDIRFSSMYYSLGRNDVEYFFRATKKSLTSATLPWMVREKTLMVHLLKHCDVSLRKLRLLGFSVPTELEAAAFEAIGELHTLQELDMSAASPSQPLVVSLPFRPGCLTQLRRLHLQNMSKMQDETVIAISQGCPNLRELKITGAPDITDMGLIHIHHLERLEILDLSGCNGLGRATVAHLAQLPALHTLVLQHIEDLSKLQPSLKQIVNMTQLRCLDILKSRHNQAVPFDEFPGRLVKLRVLRVTFAGSPKQEHSMPENFFTELRHKMPHLRILHTPEG